MDSAHSSIDKAHSEALNDEKLFKSGDRKRADALGPVANLFDGRLVSASGDFYLHPGAQEYKIYLEQAVQLCGPIMDRKLSQDLDAEMRYMGEGRVGHWVAINNVRLSSNVVLEVHSVTHWNLMQWKFTDNRVSGWAELYPRWPHQAYFAVSHCLCTVLRHVGCIDGGFLGCDSGGWFLLSKLAEQVYTPYLDDGKSMARCDCPGIGTRTEGSS
jgi:hypothetical protein